MTQHDPALLSAALAGAERAMNQAIALAPTSHQALGGLSGTLLGVEVTTLDLTWYIEMVDATEIRLMTHCEDQPDAFVRGTLEDFGALATSEDPAATLINSGIELQGSSHSLVALQQVISRMDFDVVRGALVDQSIPTDLKHGRVDIGQNNFAVLAYQP